MNRKVIFFFLGFFIEIFLDLLMSEFIMYHNALLFTNENQKYMSEISYKLISYLHDSFGLDFIEFMWSITGIYVFSFGALIIFLIYLLIRRRLSLIIPFFMGQIVFVIVMYVHFIFTWTILPNL